MCVEMSVLSFFVRFLVSNLTQNCKTDKSKLELTWLN